MSINNCGCTGKKKNRNGQADIDMMQSGNSTSSDKSTSFKLAKLPWVFIFLVVSLLLTLITQNN